MKNMGIAVLSAAILFTGCATSQTEAPQAVEQQQKVQAGTEWKMMADDLAKSIVSKIGVSKTIYVNTFPENEKSKFNSVFHTMLVSALVSNGMNVSKSPTTANAAVDINIQAVKFSKEKSVYEVIVTVSVSDKNLYLARLSNIYYVADRDELLYSTAPDSRKTINIVGDK